MGNATGAAAHTGQKVTYDDAVGRHVAVKEYDQIGTSTTLTPLITQYLYNPMSELVQIYDAKLDSTLATYDTLGQMVTLTSPDAGKTEFRFDLGGNLGWKQTAALAAQSKNIQYLYDYNRLKQITYPSLPAVVYQYGLPTDAGDSNGNLAGRVKQVTMEGGSELRYYDKMGNVNKTVTTLKHLAQPSLAAQVFTMKFSYDSFGRMQTMTFPNWIDNNWANIAGEGELVTYSYDLGGNIDKITGHQQTTNPQHPEFVKDFAYLNHIGYDEFEQRRIMTSGNGIVNKYGYDPLTRRLKTVNAASLGAQEKQLGKPATPFHAMTYYYDLVGNITKVENATTVYTWQNASVRTGPLTMSYTYDNLYQLTSATGMYRPDAGYGYQYSSAFQYDEVANLTKKSQSACGASRLSRLRNIAGGIGNPSRVPILNENRLVWDNQNPPAGLAALSGSRFDHTVSSYSYTLGYNYVQARPHAATKITETSSTGSANDHVYSYDGNGNNTGNVYMGGTRTLTWDEENRLKEVKDAAVSRGKFLYSPDGERTQRQTAAGDAFYVNQFFVLQPSGILPTKHIFAGETRVVTKTDPISQVPMISYYHPDHLGSTSYTSAGDQSLLQHERYFPFGERDTGDQEECDLGRPDNMRRSWIFNSKELDFDTGLYYFGARYYDPKTSVWQSPDPILAGYMKGRASSGVIAPRSLALYTYSWNNPVVLKDPNGEEPIVAFLPGSTATESKQFKASADALVVEIRATGIPVRSAVPYSGVTQRANAVEKGGQKVSSVTIFGHGGEGQAATQPGPGGAVLTDKSVTDVAADAKVASGGLVAGLVCGSAEGDASQFVTTPGGVELGGVFGPVGFSRPDENGQYSGAITIGGQSVPQVGPLSSIVKGGKTTSPGSAVLQDWTSSRMKGKTLLQNIVTAERQVNAQSAKRP
jgi:RHS repeat-associated protein